MHCDGRNEYGLTEDVFDIEEMICRIYFDIAKDYFSFDEKDGLNGIKSINCNKIFRKIKAKFAIKPKEFLYFGIVDTYLASQRFNASLENHHEISKYLSVKNPIRIYCPHGESIHSVLGVCIVINKIAEHYGYFNKKDLQQIHVTLNEKRPFWKYFSNDIIQRMNLCYKNIEIKLEILEYPANCLSNEVIAEINKADVLVMARFLSKFRLNRLKQFCKTILEKMKKLSILFYLDEYHHHYCRMFKSIISKTDSWMEIKFTEPADKDQGKIEHMSEGKYLLSIDLPSVVHATCIKYREVKINNVELERSVETNISSNVLEISKAGTARRRNVSGKVVCRNLLKKNTQTSQKIESNRLPRKLDFYNLAKKNKCKKNCLMEYTLSFYGNDIEIQNDVDIEIQNDINEEFSVEKEYLEYFGPKFCRKANKKSKEKKTKKSAASKKKLGNKIKGADVSVLETGSNQENTGVLSEKVEKNFMTSETKVNSSKKKTKSKQSKTSAKCEFASNRSHMPRNN